MESSDNEFEEEEEAEWKSCFTDSTPVNITTASGSSLNKKQPPEVPHRVILHFDLDCFYAQVEMIRNPALRDVPLGIQQKYIVVTCNYVAREHGVTKLMSVTEAKDKCPQLVLVKGEDLTHYREMSYRVTELLMSYCPLVERLGFDENFMDITEMVVRRLTETPQTNNFLFNGHVYNHLSADAKASDHQRLALGSHIAAELREAIHSKLGLTGCAGIATSKLLAKLVSGTFKPNQQTTLLPENVTDILGCLSGLRKVPGVGHQTAKRLQALGLVSVQDLQLFPLADLMRELGSTVAHRLKNLALGIDESPVTPTGAPQSLSDEDSFKKMTSAKDVLQKIQDLLSSLVERMHNDGRQPQTFRLTIRRYSATNKWFSRESRQCPIPNHIQQKITSGMTDDTVVQLVPVAMKLFHKMVDSSKAFHLTLINVCFTNLQARGAAASGKGSITSFFTQSTISPRKTQISQSQVDPSQSGDNHCMDDGFSTHSVIAHQTVQKTVTTESLSRGKATLHRFLTKQSPVVSVGLPSSLKVPHTAVGSELNETNNTLTSMVRLPPNVDPEVFRHLPEEIQKELLPSAYANSPPGPLTHTTSPSTPAADISDVSRNATSQCSPSSIPVSWSLTDSQSLKDRQETVSSSDSSDRPTTMDHQWPPGTSAVPGETVLEEGRPSDCDFPVNVDPKVFSELPPYVQRELMCEWKQQKSVLKTPSYRQLGRTSMSKDKKPAGKGSQANSLLKYFKPN